MKCAIFDLDGTLIDSNGVWKELDRKMCIENNIAVSEGELNNMAGMTYEEVRDFLDKKGRSYSTADVERLLNERVVDEYRDNIKIKAGVKEFLEKLKKENIKITLATASPDILYIPVLKNNGVYDYFDLCLSVYDVQNSKEHPDIYFEICRRLDVKPEECTVFEDGLTGAKTADLIGMKVVMVYDKYKEKSYNEKNDFLHIMSFNDYKI